MTKDLLEGLYEFKKYHYDTENSRMQMLAELGQDPKYFIISCIDSRCNPVTIFRAQPGIFFTHKAMGAIVRPYKQGTALSAALQFALEHNNIETVIIMGHTGCGAIKALAENLDDPEITSFIEVARHCHRKAVACCDTHEDIIAKTEREVILESMENLQGYPSVNKALNNKQIKLKAWQFDMKSGDLFEYNTESKDFARIAAEGNAADNRKIK